MTLEEEVRELAKFAKAASAKLAQATTEERNGALYAMAAALRAQAPALVEANGEDMEAARAAGADADGSAAEAAAGAACGAHPAKKRQAASRAAIFRSPIRRPPFSAAAGLPAPRG